MKRQKVYIVKHEVLATSVAEAARIGKGNIYEVSLADEKWQPQEETKVDGFKSPK